MNIRLLENVEPHFSIGQLLPIHRMGESCYDIHISRKMCSREESPEKYFEDVFVKIPFYCAELLP